MTDVFDRVIQAMRKVVGRIYAPLQKRKAVIVAMLDAIASHELTIYHHFSHDEHT